MKVDITDKSENLLLSRLEVKATTSYEGKPTPSMKDVQNALSKSLESDSSLIVIKKIDTSYGNGNATILAYKYINKEERDKLEPQVVANEQKAAEAKKEDKKDSKEEPTEVKKEDAKKSPEDNKSESKTESKEEVKKEPETSEKEKSEAPKESKKE